VKKHITAILGLLFVAACSKAPAQSTTTAAAATTTPAQATAQPAPPAPPKPVPAELPEIVARVNGKPIARTEFEAVVKQLEAAQGQAVPAAQRDEIFRGVLDRLVLQQVLLQEVQARKVDVPATDVDARVNELQQRFPSADEFGKALTQRGMSLDKLKADLRNDLAINKMIETEVTPKIAVTDQDVKDYYDKNPDQFKQPESVRASHILIKVDQTATDAQKNDARAKIDDVLKQVKAGGDFAELAKKHSQDGSAAQGGDLNYFQKGQMVPPFETAAWALTPGQVSAVVETQFGFHIIKLTDKKIERVVPLAEVNVRLAEFLKQRKGQEMANAFVEAVKAKSKIEILL
jgi:peptidyl-prolyl cis-trans isomerase C